MYPAFTLSSIWKEELVMKTRRQDFSQHEEIFFIASRAKLNQEVIGELKTDTPNWNPESVRIRMTTFLNWLLFESKFLETQVEWVSELYTLRVDEVEYSKKEGHLETLLTLKERKAFTELKEYLLLYAGELLELRQ